MAGVRLDGAGVGDGVIVRPGCEGRFRGTAALDCPPGQIVDGCCETTGGHRRTVVAYADGGSGITIAFDQTAVCNHGVAIHRGNWIERVDTKHGDSFGGGRVVDRVRDRTLDYASGGVGDGTAAHGDAFTSIIDRVQRLDQPSVGEI